MKTLCAGLGIKHLKQISQDTVARSKEKRQFFLQKMVLSLYFVLLTLSPKFSNI